MRWSQISPVCVFTGPSSELLEACSIIKTVVGRSLETLADQHFKFIFSGPLQLSLHISVVELVYLDFVLSTQNLAILCALL